MIKKFVSVILCLITFFSLANCVIAENEIAAEEVPQKKEISAASPYVVLADLSNGMIIYEKNSDKRVYPADLTKIMTAVLVLENCKMEDMVTASETAISNVKTGDSKLGLVKEEKLSVRQLLYAMLLGSASDASNVLAEQTSGSIEEFVVLMNEKAKVLGMNNTNFTNPTGEHDERHYTTAVDMTALVVYAMQSEEFREIVKCDSYSIPATNKNTSAHKVVNTNHFVSRLRRGDYYYKYSTGIKTGYNQEAKSCIAASASKNGMELLALVFGAETVDNVAQSFKDCKNMFDFTFENYVRKDVVGEGEIVAQIKVENTRRNNKLILKTDKELSVINHKDKEELKVTYKDSLPAEKSAPIKEKEVIGTREYFIGGKSIGTLNLVADKDYALDPITFVINKMIAFVTSPWLYVAIFLAIVVLVLLERRRRRIIRRKRREARARRNREMTQKINEL